jgi:hypothetical protein
VLIGDSEIIALGTTVIGGTALEPLKNGLMGTLLRYPSEVRSEDEYFDDIQDVKVTKDTRASLPPGVTRSKSGANLWRLGHLIVNRRLRETWCPSELKSIDPSWNDCRASDRPEIRAPTAIGAR